METRIVIEGLPGSGKSTIASWLASEMGCAFFPEHVINNETLNLLRKGTDDSEKVYFYHWEVKSKLQSFVKGGLVSDRNYLTTLAYNFGKSKFLRRQTYYRNALSWYQKSIREKTIIEPEIYIILEIPATMCNKRKNRGESDLLWTKTCVLYYSEHFYTSFQDTLFIKDRPKIIRVDATVALDEVKRQVLSKIDEI